MGEEGNLKKMRTVHGAVVEYYLPIGHHEIAMNPLIGQSIRIEYTGEIHCIRCGRKTSKSFAQGYCFPCFKTAPETEECVLHPERCRAHEGVARDMKYAREHCLIEHVVYLSVTNDLKVGVTRNTQVPVRWIDQGAVQAIELVRTPNRYTAGAIEVALKQHLKDKTNWRAMLKNEVVFAEDLQKKKGEVLRLLSGSYRVADDHITTIRYPVEQYPETPRSLTLEKEPVIEGELTGIKGQYLIFRDGGVINIRKYGGYRVRISG
jgi:hypothetical protein